MNTEWQGRMWKEREGLSSHGISTLLSQAHTHRLGLILDRTLRALLQNSKYKNSTYTFDLPPQKKQENKSNPVP